MVREAQRVPAEDNDFTDSPVTAFSSSKSISPVDDSDADPLYEPPSDDDATSKPSCFKRIYFGSSNLKHPHVKRKLFHDKPHDEDDGVGGICGDEDVDDEEKEEEANKNVDDPNAEENINTQGNV